MASSAPQNHVFSKRTFRREFGAKFAFACLPQLTPGFALGEQESDRIGVSDATTSRPHCERPTDKSLNVHRIILTLQGIATSAESLLSLEG